jgi:hypothetical protein
MQSSTVYYYYFPFIQQILHALRCWIAAEALAQKSMLVAFHFREYNVVERETSLRTETQHLKRDRLPS